MLINPKPIIFRQIREIKRRGLTDYQVEKILTALWYAIDSLDFYEDTNNWNKKETGEYVDYEQDLYKTIAGQDEGKNARQTMMKIIKYLKEAGV